MNEMEIELRLERLARADDAIRAPARLRDRMRDLEAGAAEPAVGAWERPRLLGRRAGRVRIGALVGLAAAIVVAAGLLFAVAPRHDGRRDPVAAPSGPSFSPSSFTKDHTFPGSATSAPFVASVRSDEAGIYGLFSMTVDHPALRWGPWSGLQSVVISSPDGRAWSMSSPLPDLVTALEVPPMDASDAITAVARHAGRFVVVGGLAAAPASVARSDGQEPVESIGVIWTSDDGRAWHEVEAARQPGYVFQDVVWTQGGFVAVAVRAEGGMRILTSADGERWSAASAQGFTDVTDVLPVKSDPVGGFLVVGATRGEHGLVSSLTPVHSADGRSWSSAGRLSLPGPALSVVYAYRNGRWTVDAVIGDHIPAASVSVSANADHRIRAHLETAVLDGGSWRWLEPTREFDWLASPYSAGLDDGGATLAAGAWVDEAEGSAGPSPSQLQPAPVRFAWTADAVSWTPAGSGPTGTPLAELKFRGELLLFVSTTGPGVPSVEVWSAPWPN